MWRVRAWVWSVVDTDTRTHTASASPPTDRRFVTHTQCVVSPSAFSELVHARRWPGRGGVGRGEAGWRRAPQTHRIRPLALMLNLFRACVHTQIRACRSVFKFRILLLLSHVGSDLLSKAKIPLAMANPCFSAVEIRPRHD